jgi:signal transduction histidine kinase
MFGFPMPYWHNVLKYVYVVLNFKDLKICFINDKYNEVKGLIIRVQFTVSFLAYVVIAHGYHKAGYISLMVLTLFSLFILTFFCLRNWQKRLPSDVSALLFIYIPIANILIKDVFFLFQGNSLINTIFLHTHFMLLLFISFGGLVSSRRNILFVGIISVIWIWVFTIYLDDSFLWSLILLDTVFFAGITLIIYFAYSCIYMFNQKLGELAEVVGEQNEELNSLISLKDWMLNVIVHDIKNPINRILSACKKDIIQKEEVIHPSKYILSIVENILDVYKMEESNMLLNLSFQDIDVIVNKAYEQVKYLLDGKMMTLVTNVSVKSMVEVDEELLVRVFINIFTNSVKYSKANSCIQIIVTRKCEWFRVEIIDSGVGVAPEDVDRIFEKHYQANARNLGYTRSGGIGLNYCKLVVEAHGGRIGAESEFSSGTTIWFELPVVSADNYIKDVVVRKSLDVKNSYRHEEEVLLLEYKFKLASLAVYQTSEIIMVLKPIPPSSKLYCWHEDVIKSSMLGNEELFNQLKKVSDSCPDVLGWDYEESDR